MSAEVEMPPTSASATCPEHPQKERRKKRSVYKTEHQLNDVHRIVIHSREVGACDTEQDADHCDGLSHPEIVLIALLGSDVGLIQVIGPNGVESCHVSSHAR